MPRDPRSPAPLPFRPLAVTPLSPALAQISMPQIGGGLFRSSRSSAKAEAEAARKEEGARREAGTKASSTAASVRPPAGSTAASMAATMPTAASPAAAASSARPASAGAREPFLEPLGGNVVRPEERGETEV